MIPKKQKAEIEKLMDELFRLGVNIRGDWSDFDGRNLLKALEIWLYKLGKVTDIEAPQYYAGGDNPSSVQVDRIKHAFEIDVSEWFKNE